MLYKKELLDVPLLHTTIKTKKGGIVAAQIVELKKSGKVLVCDFVYNNEYNRFFTDGKTYQTLLGDRFTQAYPDKEYQYYEEVDGSLEAVRSILCNNGRTVSSAVRHFIWDKKYDMDRRSFKRKWDLFKQHQGMFPEHPKNLAEYCEKSVFQSGYMFISKKDPAGHRYGVCSHCRENILLDTKKCPTGSGYCPHCGKRIMYKQAWQKSQIVDKEPICITHRVDGQLLIRWTRVTRTIYRTELKTEYDFEDYGYNLHLRTKNGNTLFCYKMFSSFYSYGPEWHRLKNGEIIFDESYVYTDNLDDVFGSSYYNVNLKAGLEGKRCKLSFAKLLNNLKNIPTAEHLFKLGLPIFAANSNSLVGDPAGNGMFHRATGVSKQYLPMYRDMCVTMDEHILIKNSKQFVRPEELQALRDLGLSTVQLITAAELIESMTIHKFIRYMGEQSSIKRDKKYKLTQLLIEYRDYLSMSKDLGVDLSHKAVRFPADIVEAHKTITERFNLHKTEIQIKKAEALNQSFYEKTMQHYKRFGISEYSSKDFCIVCPQSIADIIREGQSQNHCVGQERYYKNHMKGTRMIFFVRKISEPDKPFFTLELDMGTFMIIQLYGFGNCSAPQNVRAFAENFAKQIKRSTLMKTA